ncbi:2-oxoglutarate dehydrogenase complex dihydrolipoyllysine-residue succinyltransferase [Texcoconibacillus texcoconensis]|nr:2-oxoglutarate dehydrogenase complex dihydrolipoyllysine-residue succinyltransferase [Texcoconibacillus texcoconensis]
MKDVVVPELAESVTEGTVAEWLQDKGSFIEKGQNIVELETDKVNVEITAEDSGVLVEVLSEPGDTVEVGDVIAKIDETKSAGDSSSEDPSPEEKQQSDQADNTDASSIEKESSSNQERPVATPAARRYAREKGIDLADINAQDPLGRVRKEDVERHSTAATKQKTEESKPSKAAAQSAATTDVNAIEKPVERQRMSRRRQTIAKRLVDAQQTAAMLTTFNEVDMSHVMKLRKRRKDAFYDKHGVKLGMMSFFTKAVVRALKDYPYVNAEIQGDEILLKKFYDIGVAVSTDDGLVVPVVRDADRLSFAEIESNINELSLKARDNQLSLSDLQGGSFTITNGGVFGSLWSTPILNSPQVGILGMHTIQNRPVAIDEHRFENRPMMYIALSYDHRIIDGKDAVGFLVRIKELIEDPESLLLEG